MHPYNDKRLLEPQQAAELLGTTISTLSSWRVQGIKELPWVKVGKLVRYQVEDVLAYIERQKQGGVSHESA